MWDVVSAELHVGWQTCRAGDGGLLEAAEASHLEPQARRHQAGGGVELYGR